MTSRVPTMASPRRWRCASAPRFSGSVGSGHKHPGCYCRRDRLLLHRKTDTPDAAAIRGFDIDAPLARPRASLVSVPAIAVLAPAHDIHDHALLAHPGTGCRVPPLPVVHDQGLEP